MIIKNKIFYILAIVPFILCFNNILFSQQDDFQLMVFDNFFAPENPNLYTINFSSSLECKSKVELKDISTFVVSDTFSKFHNKEIEIPNLLKDGREIVIKITCELKDGRTIVNEENTITLPVDTIQVIDDKSTNNVTTNTIVGFLLWLTPYPGLKLTNIKDWNYSINKEFTFITLGSSTSMDYYPHGYFSLEYNFLPKNDHRSFLRLGYKHIIELKSIFNYISPGVTAFTTFTGINGISPEFSVSIFRILNSFDFYIRYRFDTNFDKNGLNDHNILIGFYSNLFSLHF